MKVLLLSVQLLIATAAQSHNSSLIIEITGLRNDKGYVLINLFKGEKGFPSDEKMAIQYAKLPIKEGKAIWYIPVISPGEYAISYIHDENDNGKMDTGLFGIPKEGYGASNDTRNTFGPPSYSDAKFQIIAGQNRMEMKTAYW